jgi:hypothetical protein
MNKEELINHQVDRMICKAISGILASALVFVSVSFGQGNTFKKVKYQGGSVASTVKPDDWDNTLTVTPELITLKLKDGVVQDIDPKKVTGMSYGQEAHRRVGTMIALAVLLTPFALFGLMHKTRKHFIGLEWTDGDKKNGILLQGDKDDYRGMLMALRGVTGAAVSVAEADRKYVPTGIQVITTADSKEEVKSKDEKAKEKATN